MTAGSSATCAGVPSAMTLPKLRTVIAVADVHHQPDVVLDEEDRVALRRDLPDERRHRLDLDRVHPGGRLVEQEQLRLGGERAGDLDPPLLAVGEVLHPLAHGGRRARPARGAPPRARGPPAPRRAAAGSPRSRAASDSLPAQVLADDDVVARGQLREEPDVLEGARDAERGDAVRARARGRARPSKLDRAGASAASRPETRLMIVVFPAPFGPMRPCTSPGATSKARRRRRATPPKMRSTLSSARRARHAARAPGRAAARAAAAAGRRCRSAGTG